MSEQQLRLNLIDGFHASVSQQKLLLPSAASERLLAYLALCHGMKETRSRLATLLWEDSDEVRARRNLRQMLYTLRMKVGIYWNGLQSNRHSLFMDDGCINTDHNEIFTMLNSGIVPEPLLGVVQIQEKLLARINFPGELLSSWVQLMRREFENNLRTALETILIGDDAVEKERAARAILGLDAADETAARILMETYWERGDLGKALGVYSHLWNHIDDVYGMEPTLKTQELIAKIKTSDYSEPGPLATTRITATKITVGISPAMLWDASSEASAIAVLFRSEIISCLINFPEFNIVDETVMKTECDYRLGFSFLPADDYLRMSVNLTRVCDDIVVWTGRFVEVVAHWRDHQAELVGSIVEACGTTVSQTCSSCTQHHSLNENPFDNWLVEQTSLQNIPLDRVADAGISFYKPAATLTPDRHALLCRAWASCLLEEYSQIATIFSLALECDINDPRAEFSAAIGTAFEEDRNTTIEVAHLLPNEGEADLLPRWGYHSNIRFLAGDYAGSIMAAESAENSVLNIQAWKAAAHWYLGETEQAVSAWIQFEISVKDRWGDEQDATTKNILSWFLACFPVTPDLSFERVKQGAANAAYAYRSWS